jgi:ElaB/YqjD/DUF883 family membrane-anchored ribosome-binding protein
LARSFVAPSFYVAARHALLLSEPSGRRDVFDIRVFVDSKDFQPWPLHRATPERSLPKVGEIERRLHVLEKSLEKIGARTSSNARETADGLTEAIASALFGWADRFRQGASSFGDQSTAFGKDAARYGSAALTRVTEETEQRPLLAIAVALGVGILIGMAARGRT